MTLKITISDPATPLALEFCASVLAVHLFGSHVPLCCGLSLERSQQVHVTNTFL